MFHRFDLYGPVHKGLRLALSGLCTQVGSTDSSEVDKVQAFMEEFRRVVIILESHSRDEDANINESYEKYAVDTLQELEAEHETLEHRLAELVNLVDQFEKQSEAERSETWYRIGKELNRFTADYFIHLQREEGPGMNALWANLTDAELMDISKNIRSSIPPQAMAIFMHYVLPAISHQERVGMLSEMKRFAPAEAYSGMLALASTRLDLTSWNRLNDALQAVQSEGVVQ